MSRLFVIEASGKARTFQATLRELGEDAVVQFTLGHLFELPAKFDRIGVDSAFRDFERKPLKLDICEKIRAQAMLADDVVVATDADLEGDVIAWDVVELVRDFHPAPKRMRLKGMDKESVRQALADLGPVLKQDAVPGRARAIVDRLIGAAFTTKEVSVGRVSTAMLGLVAAAKPGVDHLRLVAPSKDGGRPYSAECPVEGALTPAIAAKLAEMDFPALGLRSREPFRDAPGHTGDLMVKAGDALDISPKQASERMQRNYETGQLSYPRAGSKAYSPLVAQKMAEVLRKAGYGGAKATNFPPKPEGDVHDAPYPIGKVDLSSDPRRLDEDAGVRAVIARSIARAGVERVRETALAAPIGPFLVSKGIPPAVAAHVASLDWRREAGPRMPGQEAYPESGVVRRRADVVMLERCIEAGLGRPSTWGRHIDRFMARGLVTDDLRLTAKGRRWHEASPEVLLDPRVSAAIERYCEKFPPAMMDDPDREPWELVAARITGALPPAIREPMESLIRHEAPRPKSDPVRDYGLDRKFADEAARAALPDHAYAPTLD